MNSQSLLGYPVLIIRSILLTMPRVVLGSFSMALLIINTLFWSIFLFPMAGIKLIARSQQMKDRCNAILKEIGLYWIACNNLNLAITKRLRWTICGIDGLEYKGWYLVISNHQTWVDILILQKLFHRKIPFLKFFLKQELIKVPIMGLAWWALEFPFMKRYSSEFLKQNPHLKGKDMDITRKACERFKRMPISVMNFVEGTRFTREKHNKQKSPFKHLLRPKAGGISFVLSAMGDQLTHIVNVTIVYPQGPKTFWEFLCSKECDVVIQVDVIPITKELLGDYSNDPVFRDYFQDWLNKIWAEKDACIENLLNGKSQAAGREA